MTTATLTPWLARYCRREPMRNEWMKRVVSLDGYSVATDGKGIVAVKDGGVQEWPPVWSDTETASPLLKEFLHGPARFAFRCPLAHLLTFAGHVQRDKCEDCDGAGSMAGYHDPTCPECEGRAFDPWSQPDVRQASIAGLVMNLNALAWYLGSELEPGTVNVGVYPARDANAKRPSFALCLETDSWRVLVMSMEPGGITDQHGNREAWKNLPTFHPEPTFAGLWLEREDSAVRLIFADWLEEHYPEDAYSRVLRGETREART